MGVHGRRPDRIGSGVATVTRAGIAGAAIAIGLFAVIVSIRVIDVDPQPVPADPATVEVADVHAGCLYGRVTTLDGGILEGRLRFGGDEEAFWTDAFNGVKDANPWADHVPEERRPREERTVGLFGLTIARRRVAVDLSRPFMARFGDIARIEARGADVVVTLKSGTAFELDRMDASDFDDGVRVWDVRGGMVDLDSVQVRTIEFLPTPAHGDAPARLHGVVRTSEGRFAGPVQWNRDAGVVTDVLRGRTDDGDVALAFERVRSIVRDGDDRCRVTKSDGSELGLSGTRDVGRGNRGVDVDDPRYGRVRIAWGAFERVDLVPGGPGPAYGDFPPGRPLTGRVTTRDGRTLAGRLVYDLDESETTETLDAPSGGVDYIVPFGRIVSIAIPGPDDVDSARVAVTLDGGETVRLERSGDLGPANAGVLVFREGSPRPEYVAWADVARVEFGRP